MRTIVVNDIGEAYRYKGIDIPIIKYQSESHLEKSLWQTILYDGVDKNIVVIDAYHYGMSKRLISLLKTALRRTQKLPLQSVYVDSNSHSFGCVKRLHWLDDYLQDYYSNVLQGLIPNQKQKICIGLAENAEILIVRKNHITSLEAGICVCNGVILGAY